MARNPRAPTLETRTARLKLKPRKKPYVGAKLARGIQLRYRRNKGAGTWDVKAADGHGGFWTKGFAIADDYEDADGERVLDWFQAIAAARKFARGQSDSGRPVTVADAIDAFERDLKARGASLANAGRIRKHLTPTLASKPVGLLTARELAAWRDSLLADGMKPATVVRLAKATKAALNLAKRRDHRIRNEAAWRDGLSGIAEGFASRNVQRLDDDQVRNLIAAAYAIDSSFGTYLETAAITGARLSQIARLAVADLQADNGTPRLMMPSSRKGRNRKAGKRPVPITKGLAVKLQAAAGKRAEDAPSSCRPPPVSEPKMRRSYCAPTAPPGNPRRTAITNGSTARRRIAPASAAPHTRFATRRLSEACWPTSRLALSPLRMTRRSSCSSGPIAPSSPITPMRSHGRHCWRRSRRQPARS
jgi:integrase